MGIADMFQRNAHARARVTPSTLRRQWGIELKGVRSFASPLCNPAPGKWQQGVVVSHFSRSARLLLVMEIESRPGGPAGQV